MPYIPYTDEQKQLAGSVDLPTFLRMRGEKLVPVGREFLSLRADDTAIMDYMFNAVRFFLTSQQKFIWNKE